MRRRIQWHNNEYIDKENDMSNVTLQIRTVTSMLALIMSVTGHVAEASDFVSPCPSVFKYEPQGNEVGKWYGVANFTSEFTLYGLWMNIVLDSKADILGVSYFFIFLLFLENTLSLTRIFFCIVGGFTNI